ncbi:MAG TPA: hypothetical protein DER09_10360 [Prolixibacteraceae bacterium]|nr:hypothetical protein [Prolixibacteraceae bacterium]
MNFQEKSEQINGLNNDILAEYLISTLIDEGLDMNDLLVFFDGHLKRNWSKDVAFSETGKYEIGRETLEIHLNRTGLYDGLPEAVFHAFGADNNSSGEEMARDSVRLKSEEKQARLLFKPFENEIFLKGTQVVTQENQTLNSVYLNFLNRLIPELWKTNPEIPKDLTSKLEMFLPHATKITGNIELMAQCLEFILNEKVVIQYSTAEPQRIEETVEKSGFSLGAGQLGKNMVLGTKIYGFVGRYIFRIGPLENHSPEYFFKNGPADSLLKSFCSYFTPFETETEIELVMNEVLSHLVLSSDEAQEKSFLGYNSIL